MDTNAGKDNREQAGVQTSMAHTETKRASNQFEALLEEYLVKKAPFALPESVKDIIVKILPYLILVLALLAIPIVLAALGLTAALTPFAMMGGESFRGLALIAGIVSAVSLVVELMAVPGLFKRTEKGWRLAYYASLIALLGNILSFNVLGGLIGALIGWYFLFQIKDRYKN